MKRISLKITSFVLLFSILLSMVGCGTKTGTTANKTDDLTLKSGLYFDSSDESFADFLNDYYSRHIRDNSENSIGTMREGTRGWWYNVSSIYSSFIKSTDSNLNGYSQLDTLVSYLDNWYVADDGSVFDQALIQNYYGTQNRDQSYGIGWPFVSGQRTSNYSAEFTGKMDSQTNTYKNDSGWTINGRDDVGSFAGDGFWNYNFNGSIDQSVVYESPVINASVQYAPFVEIAMQIKDLSSDGGLYPNIEDIILSWKTPGGEWNSMSYYKNAMYNEKITGDTLLRTWFPAYLHPSWKGNIEKLRIEIKPKAGKKLSLSLKTNYFALQTDTRLTTNNAYYLMAMEEYISWTGDMKMLENHLDDMRRALLFSLEALDGKSGLLKTDYISGKKTTVVAPQKFGMQGNGWYDCNLTGSINLEANVVFYQSILAMIKLEKLAKEAGIDIGETSIRNPWPFNHGAKNIVYSYDEQTLTELAEKVRNTVRQDYDKGGLWNPKTGRFAWGIFDEGSADGAEGEAMDYGHTEANLTAVMCGLASEEQTKSIFSWLNGDRIVEGDDSTGKDIYFYEFGPRLCTKDQGKSSNTVVQLKKFGTDIQNGGISAHISYYDLMARNSVLGANDSFKQFKTIQKWYEKVLAAGGEGQNLYIQYYASMQLENPEKAPQYSMAGGGTVGSVGLGYEFYEASLVYASVPRLYFGLDSTKYRELTVAPNLPDDLDYLTISNLMFYGVTYDMKASDNKVKIFNVRGNGEQQTIKVTFKEEKGRQVYLNNKKIDDAILENGYVTVTVPFEACTVEIK